MMKIYIPTKGRISNQLTLSNLPLSLKDRTHVVCPEYEVSWHTRNHPYTRVIAQPDPKMGIAEKRRWIIETCDTESLVMLDDDLRFAVRREDNPGLFRQAIPEDIIRAFSELENILSEDIPHAGFAVRGGGIGEAAKRGGWQTTGKRMMYSLGYHVKTVLANAVFGRISTHEDMDVTLQLLLKGFPNAVNFSFVVDQKFGNPGGCTEERTVERNNEDVLKLAGFFPGYVRVEQKLYKASTPRLEVVCAWQRALQDGISNRE